MNQKQVFVFDNDNFDIVLRGNSELVKDSKMVDVWLGPDETSNVSNDRLFKVRNIGLTCNNEGKDHIVLKSNQVRFHGTPTVLNNLKEMCKTGSETLNLRQLFFEFE